MFKFDNSNIKYIFKNNNEYDLRRNNIEIIHYYHKEIEKEYNIIEFNLGHYSDVGRDAYIIKNPMWKVIKNNNEFWLMYCETNTLCILCSKSYEHLLNYEKINNKKITFFKHANGYICSTIGLYIHQIITGCYGNGKGTKNISVDHIDQNPLNNCYNNLRVATREEQEQNSKGIKDGTKRARKTSAKPLPEGITQDMLKKYVVFYEDYADKEKQRLRQYFKVETHPKLTKPWIGSKSNKLTIQQKLLEANNYVIELDNN